MTSLPGWNNVKRENVAAGTDHSLALHCWGERPQDMQKTSNKRSTLSVQRVEVTPKATQSKRVLTSSQMPPSKSDIIGRIRHWLQKREKQRKERIKAKFAEYETLPIPNGVLLPWGRFRERWDMVMTILILWTCIRIPAQVAFSDMSIGPLFISDYLLDLLQIADVIIMSRTARIKDGNMISKPKDIIKAYLRAGLFAVDLIALFPGDVGILLFTESREKNWILPYFRLNRLLRIWRVYAWVSDFEKDLKVNHIILRFSKLIFFILILTHWIGCFWYVMENFNDFSGLQENWVQAEIDAFAQSSQLTRFLRSWYWALCTFTASGTEDYYPKTNAELIFQIICTVLGASIYASFIGNLASLIAEGNSVATHFRQRLEHVKHYMGYRGLPDELKAKVLGYYDFMWSRHKGLDENVILNDLPQQLRSEVALSVARKSVEEVFNTALGRKVKESFVKNVVNSLRPTVYSPGDWIIKQGSIGNSMYFVNAGFVEVIVEDKASGQSTVVALLKSGQYFGEKALLTADVRRASVRSSSYCDLFELSRGDLTGVLENYPEYKIFLLSSALKENLTDEQREKLTREKLKGWVSLLTGSVGMTQEEKEDVAKRKIRDWIIKLKKEMLGIWREGRGGYVDKLRSSLLSNYH